MIQFTNVTKEYANNDGSKKGVLHNVTFNIIPGTFTLFIGESGCGKSTILKILTHLIDPTHGSMHVDGSVSIVFQNGALLPWRNALENVSLPIENAFPKKDVYEKSLQALKMLHIESLQDTLPKNLSGGQRQRVGIARALVTNADILILDEPFSALDIRTARNMHTDLLTLWQQTNKTIIMVSHSIEEAVLLGQTIHVMHQGGLVKTFENDHQYPRNEISSEFQEQVLEIKSFLLNL